jgi:four helix bundle protein
MARKVDELPVYQKVTELGIAINAILDRPGVRKDWKLRNQISDAMDSATANIEEGFEQGTDRAFAKYLSTSKGSIGEIIGHLRRARRKGHLTAADLDRLIPATEEIGRMLGGFIKYLRECDWKERGRHGYDHRAELRSNQDADPRCGRSPRS